jgi:hypothetical protein
MTLIEIETSFGTIAASEQALVEAVLDLIVAERRDLAAPEDLVDAVSG